MVNYAPFGSPIGAVTANGEGTGGATPNTTGNALWYRGAARDPNAGTYQLGVRTYDPSLASFTTPDEYRVDTPAQDLSVGTDPYTQNTYSYVNGNPVNFADPSGHCVKIDTPSAPCVSPTQSATPTYKNNQISGFVDAKGKQVVDADVDQGVGRSQS